MTTGQLQCDICNNELEEVVHTNDLSTVIAKWRNAFFILSHLSITIVLQIVKIHQRLNIVIKPLHDLVKQLENQVLPL
jgi:hypothetical protein